MENASGGRGDVDSRIQVQLEEDGGGSTEQSWMTTKGRMAYALPAAITRSKSIHVKFSDVVGSLQSQQTEVVKPVQQHCPLRTSLDT